MYHWISILIIFICKGDPEEYTYCTYHIHVVRLGYVVIVAVAIGFNWMTDCMTEDAKNPWSWAEFDGIEK